MIDQKHAISGDAPKLPYPLAPKWGNDPDRPTELTLSTETGVSSVTHKTEVGPAKGLVETKKREQMQERKN